MKYFKTIMGILWVMFGLCGTAQMSNNTAENQVIFENQTNEVSLPSVLPFGQTRSTNEPLIGLKYEAMDLDEVLKQYSEWTELAIMKAPNVPAVKITLKCPKRLPKREALLAIESVLAMNGVALVPMGKFLKVVPIASARQYGMAIGTGTMSETITDTDKLVSRIIELKHIDIAEAQGTIQNLMHSYGKIMPLERINCILLTDTAINIQRILEILEVVDQPIESREELRIFPITYAKASDIMGKIEAILADAQDRESKTKLIRKQLTAARMPMRPLQPRKSRKSTPTTSIVDLLQPAIERGLVRGKVKMVADDRTNGLIVITRPEHFRFIENIIKALDRQVEPDVTIKVFPLEYAEAKAVVSLLTSLISSSSSATKTPGKRTSPAEKATTPILTPAFTSSKASQKSKTTKKSSGETQISGKLSADVKIIADDRTNALLIMANKMDMITIENLLTKLDISLAQVLIEVVIIEVGLGKDFKMGIDWLQKSMIAYNKKQGGGRRAFMGFAGASMEGTDGQIINATTLTDVSKNIAGAGSGLSYYFSIFDLNIDAVLNMLQTTTDARILSTPIILTTDNKEAKIMVGEKRPIVTSTSMSSGGTQQSGYEYKDIGIELTVTPHINKKGFVVMEVSQKINNVGGNVTIDGNEVPIITSREFGASISVNDRRTIVLGGLVMSETKDDMTKIPFLGDVPLLGYLFRYQSNEKKRGELMVMITPYVLTTPEDIYRETSRRFDALEKADNLLRRDWSETELGKMPTAAQLRKREHERIREDQERQASEKELAKEAQRAARKAERKAVRQKSLAESITNVTIKSESYILTPDGVLSNPADGMKFE